MSHEIIRHLKELKLHGGALEIFAISTSVAKHLFPDSLGVNVRTVYINPKL